MSLFEKQIKVAATALTLFALPACQPESEKALLEPSTKTGPALVLPNGALKSGDPTIFEVGDKETLGEMLGINFTSAANQLKSPCAYGFVVKSNPLAGNTGTETLTTGRANLMPGDKVVVFHDCMAVVEKLGNSRTLNSSDYSGAMGALVEKRKQDYLALGESAKQKLQAKEAEVAEKELFSGLRIITVQKNQTLSGIADTILQGEGIRFKNPSDQIAVSNRLVEAIMSFNGIDEAKYLQAGQKIRVPIPRNLGKKTVESFLTLLSPGALEGIRANSSKQAPQ